METAEDPRRFGLREGERVSGGFRRIACGQLELAIERLEGRTDEQLGTAVHETRKSLKRLRATVRLARDELGDEVYARENSAFREAGRRLAGARDSRVLLETLDALTDRYLDGAPGASNASEGRWWASTAPLSASFATAPPSPRSEVS
jgi:CHAD domain-containing protein